MSCSIKEGINKGEAKLLLSSPKYYDCLLENVESLGILECYDGVAYIGDKVNAYFKDKYDCSNLIGVCLSGFSIEQKHLGSLLDYLKKAGLRIVYIISLEHTWIKEILKSMEESKELFVCADCEVLERLNFFPFVLEQGNVMRFHTGVSNLKIVTSMEQIPNQVCSSKESLEILNMAFFMSSYVNVHSESLYKVIAKYQEFGGNAENPSLRLIKGGYPSIEKEVAIFKECYNKGVRDTVIFISCFLNFKQPEKLKAFILATLEAGWRVIFKSCPPLVGLKVDSREGEEYFIEPFLCYDNFVYYDNSKPRLSLQDLERSITMVELYSSMMYSYPVITKRPAILLYPKSQEILKGAEDCFYHQDLHLRIFGDRIADFLECVESLTKDSTQKLWEKKIAHYCESDLYNFECASAFLADWIIRWYQKRKLLIKE